MAEVILEHTGLEAMDSFHTIHNYIDTDEMILRKGAIAAHEGELVLIPINMRDGSVIAYGKGNPDWNYSAPHGAGRLMSRGDAKNSFTVSEYKKQMEGIFTTSVGRSTLDECPMAYKRIEDILDNIEPTVSVDKIITPIYNFKAGAEE
jgi:RNA-splicing ligase RtcB